MKTTEHLLGPLRDVFARIEGGSPIGGSQIDGSDPFRAIVEDLPEAFVIMDPQGLIFYCNGAFCQEFGMPLEDLVGKSIIDLTPEHRREESRARRADLQGLTPANRVMAHEFTNQRGHRYNTLYKGWFDCNGELVAVSGIARDRTDAYEYERQIEQANRHLEESNRDLQDFAHVASHDLREPLRKISAFSGRLETKYSEALDERGLDYLSRISSASTRMQTLIDDLLTFSRVQTRGSARVDCDLAEVLTGVLSDLEVAIDESGAEVSASYLPTVKADPGQMRQLLQNLIGNAIKFRKPDVAPIITVDAQRAGGRWEIVVSDNGIGFEAQHADKIFTVFQRLHARTEYDGSGVGLSVCRRIAERHGGTITAASTPGEGATFTIVL